MQPRRPVNPGAQTSVTDSDVNGTHALIEVTLLSMHAHAVTELTCTRHDDAAGSGAHRRHDAEHGSHQRLVQAQACERSDAGQPQRPRAGKGRARSAAERKQQLARGARMLRAVDDAREQQQQLWAQGLRKPCVHASQLMQDGKGLCMPVSSSLTVAIPM